MTVTLCREQYRRSMEGKGLSVKTIYIRLRSIDLFDQYLQQNNKADLRETGQQDFTGFSDFLEEQELSKQTRSIYLYSLKRFFFWLFKEELILTPIDELIPLSKPEKVEKVIFTTEEIALFLDTIEDNFHDRAYFELLYSSGLRRNEALDLHWKDLSLSTRKLWVKQGKGRRDRCIPISKTACLFLRRWKKESGLRDRDYIFPGYYGSGTHISDNAMRDRFRYYLKESGIKKKGLTIHSIRHSTATHLLEAGADIRYVSELLGHENIETTVVYTHPTEENQKKTYRMYHPRENAYYREMDKQYRKRVEVLRKRFDDRESLKKR